MKRRIKKQSCDSLCKFFSGCVSPMQKSTLVSLRCRKSIGSSTGETFYGYADDIELLLMQRSFENINSLEYATFLKQVESNMSTYVAPNRPKMSDEQLMSFIKSRHIQSASELQSWMDYLTSRYDILKTETDERIRQQQPEQQQQQLQQQQMASSPDPGVQGTSSAV